MVLRAPVKDAIGRVLLPAGEVLAGRHIEKLARWGIKTLDVEEPATTDDAEENAVEDPPVPPESVERLRTFLNEMYSDVSDDPLMKDIRELSEEHLVRNPDLWVLFRIADRI